MNVNVNFDRSSLCSQGWPVQVWAVGWREGGVGPGMRTHRRLGSLVISVPLFPSVTHPLNVGGAV